MSSEPTLSMGVTSSINDNFTWSFAACIFYVLKEYAWPGFRYNLLDTVVKELSIMSLLSSAVFSRPYPFIPLL